MAIMDWLHYADHEVDPIWRSLTVAIEKKLRIAHKLQALQAMSHALDELIERCTGGETATDECPILAELENSLAEAAR